MLYQVEGTTLRILGSMHLVPPGKKDWVEPVRRAFDWADEIYLEMTAASASAVTTTPAKLSAAQLPSELQAQVAQIWPKHLPPVASCSAALVMILMQNFGLKVAQGVEPHIERWAAGQRTFHELESPAEFMAAFDHVDLETFEGDIRSRLGRVPQSRKVHEQVYKCWRNNDTQRMETLVVGAVSPQIWEAMFVGRNRAWAPKVAAAAKSAANTLIVCDAGHLCAQGSLQDVLDRSFGLKSNPV
jgi:uncharacterized protein YbaP (TraB family)